jgi:hypothetical protein
LDILDDNCVDVHGHERALVKVDAESGGVSKALEQPAHTASRRHIRAEDQKRVVGVLKDGARSTVHNGMLEDVISLNQPLKHIGDDEEEVRRERVTLPQPTQTGDPLPRDAVEEHRRTRR